MNMALTMVKREMPVRPVSVWKSQYEMVGLPSEGKLSSRERQ